MGARLFKARLVQARLVISAELEGTKRATSVNAQLLLLRRDLRRGSISRDVVNFPSELCSRRSGVFTEVECSVV